MAIRRFDVGPARALRRATADNLPNLVAIAGPNGSGKSTLLEQLRIRRLELLEPGSELLFVGAHRTWRSGVVSEITVLGLGFGYEDVLKQDVIPGFQYGPPGGLHWLAGLARQASSADDAQALVKTAVIRILNKQRDVLTRAFRDQNGQVAPGTVPDLFDPFRELVETLLPHLTWRGVDITNSSDIKVYFSGDDAEGVTFDIDELSSGEKSAVALFLPFIEREVKALAGDVIAVPEGIVPLTVLIDEPELHLHPLLQLNVLDYMRRLASANRAQFLFTTHSPTLLDALDDRELFLLSPGDLAPENQLTRLSHSTERLELARAITGSTHILTRSKPIVLIEGEPDTGATASDERLLRLLVTTVAHWAIVAMAGKSQVIKAAVSMREAELQLPGLPVFGLVDADTATAPRTMPDYIVPWPVAMVENLLLDVEGIWQLLAPYRAATGLSNQAMVETSLRELSEARRAEEIDLRLRTMLPSELLDVRSSDLPDIEASLHARVEVFAAQVAKSDPGAALAASTAEVDSILRDGRHLESFHGKRLLRGFYGKHRISETGLGWNAFLTELARVASSGGRIQVLTSVALSKIALYFPPELVTLLNAEATDSEAARQLAKAAQIERAAWEEGRPRPDERDGLRRAIFGYARELVGSRGPEAAQALFREAARIGTL